MVYLAQGRFEESAKQFRKALAISKRCQNLRYSKKIEKNISELLIKRLLQKKLPDQLSRFGISKGFQLSDSQIYDIFSSLKRSGFEYLNVLDADTKKPTEEYVLHNNAHKLGLWHATISVLLVDKIDGHQYILLRGRTNDKPERRWDVSASGHRIPGEADLAAAVRKVQDEIGLTITQRQIKRFGSEGEFCKEGAPRNKRERYKDPKYYIYKTNETNFEVTSVFICFVNNHQRKILTSLAKSVIKWDKLSQVSQAIQNAPHLFTSSISQLNYYRVWSSLEDEINRLDKRD